MALLKGKVFYSHWFNQFKNKFSVSVKTIPIQWLQVLIVYQDENVEYTCFFIILFFFHEYTLNEYQNMQLYCIFIACNSYYCLKCFICLEIVSLQKFFARQIRDMIRKNSCLGTYHFLLLTPAIRNVWFFGNLRIYCHRW